MTLRESDAPVVPMKLENQLSRWKSINIDGGKAKSPARAYQLKVLRDSDRAPSVLSDAVAVTIRLGRSHSFAMVFGSACRRFRRV